MSKTRCYSRKDFMNDFRFPLTPARDFEVDGRPAEYASGHPKEGYQVGESIDFGNDIKDIKGVSEPTHTSFSTAVSPDQKLLAISSSHERILVYDIRAKELRQVLEGTGSLAFRPIANEKPGEVVAEVRAEEPFGKPAYTLISSINDLACRSGADSNKLIFWELDQHGRLLDEEEPIDPSAFATKAIDAILPELSAKHEWSKDFVVGSTLHADFEKALSQVSADHRRRHNTVLENARLGSFSSQPFSNDGRLLLYHYRNRTTQHGMREADKLPHVIVYDLEAGKEIHRLFGHTDAIMWSGISADGQHIASVSWDGTMRMYSSVTGELSWVTEDSGGQSWAGAFSPDSKYIIWSSKGGRIIKVHDVADGQVISTFPETVDDWCRCFVWHPDGQQVALCVGKHAYVWRPLDGPEGTIAQHFAFTDDKSFRHMGMVQDVSWMDHGRLLCLQISEGTKVVYDTQTNAKEMFKRPDGLEVAWVSHGLYGVFETEGERDFYLSIDGDRKVRYWRISVAAYPSWWDKEKEESAAATKKEPYPETGKYVKVTKVPKREDKPTGSDRDSWADKGAELWSAE